MINEEYGARKTRMNEAIDVNIDNWTEKRVREIVFEEWLKDPITKPMRDAIKFDENNKKHPADPERMMFAILLVRIREELRRMASAPWESVDR